MKTIAGNHIENVFLLGIGGIGMSALARYFRQQGKYVAGYDKTPSPLTEKLGTENISITHNDDIHFFDTLNLKTDNTLIVYTPAIPSDLELKSHIEKRGFKLYKRAEILSAIIGEEGGIAVAGTHGKTTTSTILAHLLRDSKKGCNAFLGGISGNYQTNVWFQNAAYTVVEADEYDRSFLHLNPQIAIITSVAPDHLDIYSNEDDFKNTFQQFLHKVKDGGLAVIHKSVKLNADKTTYLSYHLNDNTTDVYTSNLKINSGKFVFDLHLRGKIYSEVEFAYPGYHNLENFLAAVTVADYLGVEENEWRKSARSFAGVKRRFEKIFESANTLYLDDYAHHPDELEALIKSLRSFYPGKEITMVFQPHLYSRTRDFMDGFADILSKVDYLCLLDIYPAREKPIQGIDSESLLKKINLPESQKCRIESTRLIEKLESIPLSCLVTAGAGDIDRLVPQIKTFLSNKKI